VGSSPDEVDCFSNLLNDSQPLTEMSTRNLKKKKINKPGGKVWPERTADNLAAIY
jgi:hypothetical protein